MPHDILNPSENHIGQVGGETILVSAAFTRPNDVNAYAASDAVSDSTVAPTSPLLQFSGAARVPGGSGYVTKLRLVKSGAVVTNAQFRVYLYNAQPTTSNDNAAFPLLWVNRAGRVGHADVTMETEGAGSDSASGSDATMRIPFVCAAASDRLYALVVAKAGYVPAALEQFYVELTIERN